MTDHDKKISGVEAPMNPVQQQSAPSEGRRRLMKGALAAPAVMTLMHGRLAAAMSAVCSDKPVPPQVNWENRDGSQVLTRDDSGKLGYYASSVDESGETTDVFYEVPEGEPQNVFHSFNCWESFPHT